MGDLTYTPNGDYLIPDLVIPETTESLGMYGMMRKNYLRDHRGIIYSTYVLQGKLFPHCLEIEQTANERLNRMMKELTAQSPPPDKGTDPIGWAGHMNSLKAQAEEVIFDELIYN